MSRRAHGRRWWLAALLAVLTPLAACGQDGDGVSVSISASPPAAGASTTGETTSEAGGDVTAVCPLIDEALLTSNFDLKDPQLTEKEPTKFGPATVYECDIRDAGELLLTAGVSTGPASGSAEANLRAALGNATGEPVENLGELGGYAEKDGIGTAAGVKESDSRLMVIFVHGAAGNKEQLVAVAQDLSQKI